MIKKWNYQNPTWTCFSSDTKNPEEFIKKLTDSFAPHIVENQTPKLLCMIVMVGAIDMADYRKEIHGYLVGNPGTGKSELIRYASQLRYRAIFADAPNASSRGLTYGQDEFQKHKILKAGLMVKNELVCLDEFPNMKNAERQDTNTVLEQQMASYHKAGFDRDTPTNVSLLAAGNPENGRWNENKTLMDNMKPVEPAVLSRMMVVRVTKTSSARKRIKHIMSHIKEGETIAPYSIEQLKGYVAHARKIEPKLSDEAQEKIIEFLEKFEKIEQDSGANLVMEARQEIELIRISTAFAKLLLKSTIDTECVKLAIDFFTSCMATLGIKTADNPIQMDLQGGAAKKEDAIWVIVSKLEDITDDQTFSEFDVLQSMIDTPFWKTPEACRSYWERMKQEGKFFEPSAGRFKRA